MEKRDNGNDILALVLKLVLGVAIVAAGVFAGIKLYKKYKEKNVFKFCDCEDDYFDDEFDCCDCGDCNCEIEAEEISEEA